MATMRQVAAHAGVSVKTVSRVFNDDPHVLPDTRSQVEAAMRELNYVPNVMATTFRSGRSSAIGIAVPDIVDPFFAEIARSVDSYAKDRGYATILTSLGDEPDRERAILESLLSRRLAGLILAPVGTEYSWLTRWREHTPIVLVDRAPAGLRTDTFHDNDEVGGHLATRHLIEHGHRRIAYFGDLAHISTETNRFAGYKRALQEAGLGFDEALVKVYVNNLDRSVEAVQELRDLPDPATAIFSGNARNTMMLVRAMAGVPLAMVGFGDFPLADMLKPAVTVIDQDPAVLGHLAAERVFLRMEHPARRVKQVNVLDVNLVERDSCKVHSHP